MSFLGGCWGVVKTRKEGIQKTEYTLTSTDHRQKFAEINIVPRRPRNLFRGSDAQQPRKADPKYGAALIKPMMNAPRIARLSRLKY